MIFHPIGMRRKPAFLHDVRRLADSNCCNPPRSASDRPTDDHQLCFSCAQREIRVLQALPRKRPAIVLEETGFSTACWLWQGCINSKGYGVRGSDGKRVLVHRAVYEALVGPLAAGMHVHHRCEQKRCVNPAHLEAHSARAHKLQHLDGPPVLDLVLPVLAEYPGINVSAVARLTGLDSNMVGVTLRRAVTYGLVRRVGRGLYEAAA